MLLGLGSGIIITVRAFFEALFSTLACCARASRILAFRTLSTQGIASRPFPIQPFQITPTSRATSSAV